jgi:phosphatidate cytidylyltransferase
MLKTRILTAILLLAVFLPALFWLPEPYWALLMALVAAVAAWEWGGLAGFARTGRLIFAGAMLCFLVFLEIQYLIEHFLGFPKEQGAQFHIYASALACVTALFFWCLIVPFWLWRHWCLGASLRGRCILLFLGFILILATWAACIFLRDGHPGILLWILGIVWVSDISAYFAGRKFGGEKLAPVISPGKTWAGVYGALGGVAVYGVMTKLAMFFPPPALTLFTATSSIGVAIPRMTQLDFLLPFLLFLVVLGILGDLFESLLKRQAGIKDSGKLLPGHGGMLDRIDSLMAVLPCSALIILESQIAANSCRVMKTCWIVSTA